MPHLHERAIVGLVEAIQRLLISPLPELRGHLREVTLGDAISLLTRFISEVEGACLREH